MFLKLQAFLCPSIVILDYVTIGHKMLDNCIHSVIAHLEKICHYKIILFNTISTAFYRSKHHFCLCPTPGISTLRLVKIAHLIAIWFFFLWIWFINMLLYPIVKDKCVCNGHLYNFLIVLHLSHTFVSLPRRWT